MYEHTYTHIPGNAEEEIEDVYVCDDCGAYASRPENVQHYVTCQAGVSDQWRQSYNDADDEDESMTLRDEEDDG